VLSDVWNHFDICKDRDYLSLVEHFKRLKKLAD
jgi:thiamine-phosphate pyrophosphorylase